MYKMAGNAKKDYLWIRKSLYLTLIQSVGKQWLDHALVKIRLSVNEILRDKMPYANKIGVKKHTVVAQKEY